MTGRPNKLYQLVTNPRPMSHGAFMSAQPPTQAEPSTECDNIALSYARRCAVVPPGSKAGARRVSKLYDLLRELCTAEAVEGPVVECASGE